jgi:hypothetical protein
MASVSDTPSGSPSKFDLPGFSLPLNFMPDAAKFWNLGKQLIDSRNLVDFFF